MATLALAAAAAACSEEEGPIPYDASTENLYLQGTLTGMELDIAEAEVLEAEREYSPSRLCEVSAEFTAMIDGAPWTIDVEMENFDPGSFGVGVYSIVGSDVAAGPGQTSFELRMDGDTAHFERSAISGSIEVKAYDASATQAGSPAVMEGGSFGAVLQVDFGAGEAVKGSFHVNFTTNTLDGDDC